MRLSQASNRLVSSVVSNPLLLKQRDHPCGASGKISIKDHISYPLLRTCVCAYHRTKSVILSEMFARELNGCFPTEAEVKENTVLIM